MALQQRAAADAECEAAYHCLMAALRLAEHQGDAEAVDRVDAAVQAVGGAVEAISPPHALSRQRAQGRGQPALVDSMKAHVAAVRWRMKSSELRSAAR